MLHVTYGAKVDDYAVVARFAVEGACVLEAKVVAIAAEEDVTRIEDLYGIITTEATEHVGTLGAADEGVLGGVEAGSKRLNRQLRALGVGRTAYGLGLGHPREGHSSRHHRGHRHQHYDVLHKRRVSRKAG